MGSGTVQPLVAPGSGAALITLFGSDGSMLAHETAEFAALLVTHGAASVLVGGTVGEYYALSDDERAQLFAQVREAVPAEVPVMGHVGGVPVDRAVWLSHAAAQAGLTAVLALALADVELQSYYESVAAAAQLPLLAYHFPVAGSVVPVNAIRELPVVGVKDSSGDAGRLVQEVFSLDTQVYTGAAGLFGLVHDLGAAGALTGIANLDPENCALAISGSSAAQCEIARLGLEISLDFPAVLKSRIAQRFGVPAFARTPSGRPVGKGAR